MPLGRYFLFVGGLLLAVLFIAERYWPAASVTTFQTEARFDKSIIRVRSSHQWPERIIIDTSLPTFVPPPYEPAAEVAVVVRAPREAFAQSEALAQSEAFAQSLAPAPKMVSGVPRAVRMKRKSTKPAAITRVAAYPQPEALPAGW